MVVKVTRVERVRFPKSQDVVAEKALLQQLSQRRSQANQILDEYAKALKVGGKALRSAGHYVAHSFSVKLTSAIVQNKRHPFDRRASLIELEAIAHDLHLEAPCDELVPFFAKPKSNGGWRAIGDFGYAHRTAQTVGRRMLQRHVVLRPWQYDFQGTAAAIAKVRDAVLSGKTHVAIVDIKNFYGSFEEMALREELPLPVKMVDNYLVGRKLKLVPRGIPPHILDDLVSKARSGVPHGSSASPIIGAHTVSKLNWQPAPGIVPVGYVDDAALVGGSHDEVAADAKAVCAAISALPTGNFVGVAKWIGHVSEGFDFLGVHIRMDPELRIHPIESRLEQFKAELSDRCKKANVLVSKAAQAKKAKDRPHAIQAIADVWQYAHGWVEAYRVCNDIDAIRKMAFAPVDQLRAKIHCSIENLKQYMSDASSGGYPD